MTSSEDLSSLSAKKTNIIEVLKSKKMLIIIGFGLILISSIFLLI